jgi:hypothetical protein
MKTPLGFDIERSWLLHEKKPRITENTTAWDQNV